MFRINQQANEYVNIRLFTNFDMEFSLFARFRTSKILQFVEEKNNVPQI